MKFLLFTIIFFGLCGISGAQNPISPAGVYLADPSARVWNDGRLYVYGSLDENCDHYCSPRNPVMVTSDLIQWELVREALASTGETDGVPYNDKVLYAPDAGFRNGVYYLYYCQPDRTHAEGVAWSEQPTGPFREGKPINLFGHNQIDPAVFIDDDGTAYYLWGQFSLKMARLTSGMIELDSVSLRDSVLTEQEHHFHEGAFLTKRNGLYYLVYADISRGDIPTCIGYATAEKPFGPYTYRGVIIDNAHCNPGNWNNHGSIAGFNGRWYVFYHRSTHGCHTMRKACMEPIRFLPDGSIPEVEMTSQGAAPPLDARSVIQAEWACILNGQVRVTRTGASEEALSDMHTGDKAAFRYLDFGEGADTIQIRLHALSGSGKLVVSLDKPWHHHLAVIPLEAVRDSAGHTVTFPVTGATGTHAVWLHFYGDAEAVCSIDWFTFR